VPAGVASLRDNVAHAGADLVKLTASNLRCLLAAHGGSLGHNNRLDLQTTHLLVVVPPAAAGGQPVPERLLAAVRGQCGGAEAVKALRRRLEEGKLSVLSHRWVGSLLHPCLVVAGDGPLAHTHCHCSSTAC
jgi:hypothetical protein